MLRIGDFARRGRASVKALRHRFELGGPLRERYFSSAGDQRFDLTEIQFPLRPSTGVAP